MNRILLDTIPERGRLCAVFRIQDNAPGKSTRFAGKPRNHDERFHAHAINLATIPAVSRRAGIWRSMAGLRASTAGQSMGIVGRAV
jgi:hypothetical protein